MLRRIQKAFEKALYPDKCLVCGLFFHVNDSRMPPPALEEYFKVTPLEMIFRDEMSAFLCPSCFEEFSPVAPPFCTQCGKAFKSNASENHLCGDCIQHQKPYQRIRSAGLFAGSLMNVIHKFKYAGKVQLALPLGRLLFGAFVKNFDDVELDWVIPVPLHASKFRERGFNQALLMLSQWPALGAFATSNVLRIDLKSAIMERNRKTVSQTGLDREERNANVKGAFSVAQPDVIQGKQVLLVDDVYTTGATTDECAKMLMKNNAQGVHILTLARVG